MMRSLNFTNLTRGLVVAFALLVGAVPAAAVAQSPVPSYARPNTGETIHGRIAQINGVYGLVINDSRGFVDDVTMHRGTVINPVGLKLYVGMTVTILGHAYGSTFNADEIDTPYHLTVPYAPYPYYPAPMIAPYPYYGWHH